MKKAVMSLILFSAAAGFTNCDSPAKNKNMIKESTSSEKEIIVDVRTKEEWINDGHSDCSVNYPLDQFDSKIEELKKYDKVTFVCRSGARAGVAQSKLISAGFKNKTENLGSWRNIVCNQKTIK